MKSIITVIRNYFFLEKIIKDPDSITYHGGVESFINHSIRVAERMNWPKKGYRRNHLTLAIRSIRKKYPYKTGQYDEAKEMYDAYFLKENAILSYEDLIKRIQKGEEVYVYKFRWQAPVKGKMWAEYYINGQGYEDGIYKCVRLNSLHSTPDKYYIEYKSAKDEANTSEDYNYCSGSFSQEFQTAYLYATEHQISSFKERVGVIKRLEEKLKKKQEEVYQIQKNINLVNKLI